MKETDGISEVEENGPCSTVPLALLSASGQVNIFAQLVQQPVSRVNRFWRPLVLGHLPLNNGWWHDVWDLAGQYSEYGIQNRGSPDLFCRYVAGMPSLSDRSGPG